MHFMMGVIDYNEAEMMNRYNNSVNETRYQQECYKLVSSLYASFVHQFASQIESATVYVLNRENAIKDRSCYCYNGRRSGEDKRSPCR